MQVKPLLLGGIRRKGDSIKASLSLLNDSPTYSGRRVVSSNAHVEYFQPSLIPRGFNDIFHDS